MDSKDEETADDSEGGDKPDPVDGPFVWESLEQDAPGSDVSVAEASDRESPSPADDDPGDESEATNAGMGGESDRLWNSYGTAGDGSTVRSDESPAETTESEPAPTGDGSPAETSETDPTAEKPDGDSDRVWNGHRPSGDATVGDDSEERTAGDADSGAAERSGSARSSSASESSFDDLLERSAGGGASRSGSVETDLAAFFGDFGEFDRATAGSQVLVISPRDHSITDDVCSQFLTPGGVSGRNVMFVTTTDSPAERLQICRDNSEWTGGNVAVIELGDTGGGSAEVEDTLNGHPVVHKRVNSPKNFSKTGLLIMQTLKKWTENSQPTVLCFHTLTAISDYVQDQVLFQFLFTLQAKLNSLGVTGHYHMDSNRHDQQELNTLKPVFDLVIEVSPDGEIEVE